MGAGGPPRIVMAIILAERRRKDEARALLAKQVLEHATLAILTMCLEVGEGSRS